MDLSNLSWTQTLLVYVGIPVAIWLVIWFLWALPAWRKQTSYHPGDAWLAEPQEFDGGLPAAPSAPALEQDASDAAPSGGTSARW